MKKYIWLILALILISGLIFSGCTKSEPASQSASPSASSAQPVAAPSQGGPAVNPIVLKFANAEPPTSVLNENHKWWMAQIEKQTNGRVKFEAYLAGSLGKTNELSENCEQGVADAVFTGPGYNPGRYPVSDLILQLNFSIQSIWHNKMLYDRLNETELFKDEFSRVKLAFFVPMQSHNLFLKKKVTRMEDLKGLRIRTQGANKAATIMGMDPVAMSYGELEMSLERGILDGVLASCGPIHLFGAAKYVPYALYEPFASAAANFVIMNKDTWNKLPADIQETIETVNWAAGYHCTELMARANQDYMKLLKEQGTEFYFLDPVELQRWKDATKNCAVEYAAQLESKGVPANAALQQIMNTVEYTRY